MSLYGYCFVFYTSCVLIDLIFTLSTVLSEYLVVWTCSKRKCSSFVLALVEEKNNQTTLACLLLFQLFWKWAEILLDSHDSGKFFKWGWVDWLFLQKQLWLWRHKKNTEEDILYLTISIETENSVSSFSFWLKCF